MHVDEILGHTAFINFSGYAIHARNFFTALNKHIPTRIRNFAHTPDISHLTEEQRSMLINQTWDGPPWQVGLPWGKNPEKMYLNIILMESHHYYYYDEYEDPVIAYNVWESTRQIPQFFHRLFSFNQLWVPSEWQKQVTIEQGFPEGKIKVVHEGVDNKLFYPDKVENPPSEYINNTFKFIYFGRWDHRKATTECVRAFLNEFKKDEPVELILSADNPFPVDAYSSTEERLYRYGLDDSRIRIVHFAPFSEYLKYLRKGHVFLSCSRSEGWNLPLIESIACGTPTICSNYGAQLEFAKDVSHLVDIKGMKDVEHVFNMPDCPGQWAEPNFEHLQHVMRDTYENYKEYKEKALRDSFRIRNEFSWKKAAEKAYKLISTLEDIKAGDMYFVDDDIKAIHTTFTVEDNRPKVFIDSYKRIGRCHCILRDLKSNTEIYSHDFDFQKGTSVWMSPSVLKKDISGMCIEIFNSNSESIHKDEVDYDNNIVYDKQAFEYKKPQKRDNWFKDYHKSIRQLDGRIHLYETDDFLGSTVLDIGCNTGQISVQAKKWGATNVTGIDYDKEAIKKAKESTDNNEILFFTDDIDNPFFWMSIGDFDVVLYLSIIGTPELENPYGGLSKACMKTKNVMYFEGHSLHEYSEYMELLFNLTDFTEIVYKGVVQNGDRPFIRCSRKVYDPDGAIEKLKDVSRRCNKIAIIGKPHTGKTSTIRKKIQDMEEFKDFVIVDDLGTKIDPSTDGFHSLGDEYNAPFGDERYPELPYITKSQRERVNSYEKLIIFDYRSTSYVDNLEAIFNFTSDLSKIHDFDDRAHYHRSTLFKNISSIKEYYTVYNERDYVDLKPLEDKEKSTPIKVFHEDMEIKEPNFSVNFIDGPFLEVKDGSGSYEVLFIDKDLDEVVHKTSLSPNMWTRANRKYYTNWRIEVRQNGKLLFEHDLDLVGKRVLINMDSKSLGDEIAWIPYVEEFRKKWNCKVICSTFFNWLFEVEYPHLEFVPIGTVVQNLYAQYVIGTFDNNYDRNKNNWRLIHLQQTASDMLGLEFKEIKPRVTRGGVSSSVKDFTAYDVVEGSNKKLKMSLPEFWTKIYNDNYLGWQGKHSLSGIGSEGKHAEVKKNIVADIIKREDQAISPVNILDLGCGDLYWMSEILDSFPEYVNYLGIDIAQDIVDRNVKRYRDNENISFDCLDITSEGGQKTFRRRYGDREFGLVVALDIIGHLLNEEIDSLINFISSLGIKMVLLTNRETDDGKLYLTGPKTRTEGIDINFHPIFKENFELVQSIDSDVPGDVINLYKFIGDPEKFKKGKTQKYVTISEHSTFRFKYWNYPGGWQKVVNHLNDRGYKVIVISKEPTKLKNVVDRTGRILRETLANIRDSEFYIGVSSGPAWLAWALDVPVIIISGGTEKWHEISDCVRIINEDVCHGCLNDPNYPLDRGNWNWCPRGKKFECTRNITPEMVIKEVDKLIEKI